MAITILLVEDSLDLARVIQRELEIVVFARRLRRRANTTIRIFIG